MDILLIVLGILCLLLGLAGSILPALPGPPLSYIGLLFLHFTDRIQFSLTQLILWGILVILTVAFDYIMPVLGVRKWDGSRWGNRGCLIGSVAGLFIFPPWGILIGPFLGAFLGELLGGKKMQSALKAGFGAFVGFLVSVVFKILVCLWFIFCFIRAFF